MLALNRVIWPGKRSPSGSPRRCTSPTAHDRSILGWSEQGGMGLPKPPTALRLVLANGRLAPAGWPISRRFGCLVGGAVRDGLPRAPACEARPGSGGSRWRPLPLPTLSRRHGGSAVCWTPSGRSPGWLKAGGIDWHGRWGAWRRDWLGVTFRLNALALATRPGAPLLDPTAGLKEPGQWTGGGCGGRPILREEPLGLLRGSVLAAELVSPWEMKRLDWMPGHLSHLITAGGPEAGAAECWRTGGLS